MDPLNHHGVMSRWRVATGTRIARPSGKSWCRQQELRRALVELATVNPALPHELAQAGLAGRHQEHLIVDRVLKLNDTDVEVAHAYVEDHDVLGALAFIFRPAKQRQQESFAHVDAFEV